MPVAAYIGARPHPGRDDERERGLTLVLVSTRWWIAGSLLAALAFVDVLGDSSRFLGLPAIAGATVAAASVLFAVRLYETLFRAVRWIVRKIGVWAGWAT